MPRATFAAVILAVVAAVLVADDAKKPDYFPIAKGNKWEYVAEFGDVKKEAVLEITSIKKEKDRTVVEVTTTEETRAHDEKYFVTADGVTGPIFFELMTDPPARLLKIPLKTGDSWNEKLKFRGEKEMINLSTVKEPEEVKVPAGTFKAVPVVTSMLIEKESIGATMWYADGVGLVQIKLQQGGQAIMVKLKKFTPGK